jgi:hypothetical protein
MFGDQAQARIDEYFGNEAGGENRENSVV